MYSLVRPFDLGRLTLDGQRDPSVSDQLSFEKLNQINFIRTWVGCNMETRKHAGKGGWGKASQTWTVEGR